MQHYVMAYLFVIFAIIEYACILVMHHIYVLVGAAAKSFYYIFGSVICLSCMICNVIFIFLLTLC